jgi:hypothetical protein
MSKAASVRRRAVDRMAANPGLFGPSLQHHPAFALLAPAPRARSRPSEEVRARLARERLDREAAAEIEREREREIEDDRRRERERIEAMVEHRPSELTPASTVSLWPSHIRRPTRGRRW